MKATSNRPAPFLTAMLEGSFSCLIFLATIVLVANNTNAKQYAMIGFAAVSIAIAIMLALPSSWVRRRPRTDAALMPPPTRPIQIAAEAIAKPILQPQAKERTYEPEF